MASAEKYKAGDAYEDPKVAAKNFFADPVGIANGLVRDFAAVRGRYRPHELLPLIDQLVKKGEPLDDKKGTTEQLISIITALPSNSSTRTKLTNKLIDSLWDNLQHPPLSYVGGNVKHEVVHSDTKPPTAPVPDSAEYLAPDGSCTLRVEVPKHPNGMYQYRMPDGGYNNILCPDLGRAGTPYARSVRSEKKMHGTKPDPGLLFDMLLARGPTDFKENAAGISSMLFYHATIIIHDIFRTNLADRNISDVSSYLDLAPLYGSSLKDQLEIRTMKEGKLKPDTFHEKRLLGQPPGVNVMLVLYSRFHNYVADMLLKINEGGRFTLQTLPADATVEDKAKAIARQDHDLFNTARLVVGGMYINISLHDYLRAITNTHHSDSDWTLDPRVDIGKSFDSDGTPRGVGNQVSVEFNLLYRFHACISKKDEKWLNEFFVNEMFPDRTVDTLSDVTAYELMMALQAYEKKLPKDPSQRTFGGLERGPDGRFHDEDLVKILHADMNDPAGAFGARMVPKALKAIEILGIIQGRKWQVASLNEFRQFFGLKRFDTFKDINKDSTIATVLEKLYDHPDMVEMYPGLLIEDIKPAMNPGCGICPTYSVGRAILSDAITLVRSDRFNTIDFTVNNLTAWGYEEVRQDYKTLGGSMLYKLIQRGVPGWFPFNSINVMQPMFTGRMNAQIAKEIGTFQLYTMEGPKPPSAPILVYDYANVQNILNNAEKFPLPWTKALNGIWPGGKQYSYSMLGADGAPNQRKKQMYLKAYSGVPYLLKAAETLVETLGSQLMDQAAFKMRDTLHQFDVVRDLVIPVDAQMTADLFYMDVKSDENPYGKMSRARLYKHLINLRVWGFENTDPAMAWTRRRWAQEAATELTATGSELAQDLNEARSGMGLVSYIANVLTSKPNNRGSAVKPKSLRAAGKQILDSFLAQGLAIDDIVPEQWLAGVGACGAPVVSFVEILEFFLKPESVKIWARVQEMAQRNDMQGLRKYVNEAQRLTSTIKTARVNGLPTVINGNPIAPGTVIVVDLGMAGRDKAAYGSDALEFNPDRKQKERLPTYGGGIHACLGPEIALTFLTGLIKIVAGLKNLRAAPGDMGTLKKVANGHATAFLSDDWAYLTNQPTTWRMHFDGYGLGQHVVKPRTPEQKTCLHEIEAVVQKQEPDPEPATKRPRLVPMMIGVAA